MPVKPSDREPRHRRLVTGTKPTLTGPTVVLRPIGLGDAPAMFEALGDAESNRLTGAQATFTLAEVEAHCVRVAAADDRYDFAITRPGDPAYLGEAVLMDVDPRNRSAHFRISLASQSLFGLGLGTAATAMIIDFAFDDLGLHRLELEVFAFNDRARHVYESLGFVEEGVRRDALWQDGAFHDSILMSVLATD